MKKLSLLLTIFLINASSAQVDLVKSGTGSLYKKLDQDQFDVIAYKMDLQIFPADKYIQANIKIRIAAITNITDNISLNFVGLTTDSVFWDDIKTSFEHDGDELIISTSAPLLAGETAFVDVFYQGTPTRGLYFRQNSDGDTVIYSHNEPYDARFWFPCKDDPSDKASSELIINLPEKYITLSNGVLVSDSINPDSRRFSYWREDYPIATYLISIAAAKYEIVEDSYNWQLISMPLQYFIYPGYQSRAQQALEVTAEQLDFFNEYIGLYSFLSEKYSMCMVPFREASAMENQTATTMRDIIMDNENIIAHELAHQWWGDAITPESFVDIWLNEGFASYFDVLFTEDKYGREAYEQRMAEYKAGMTGDGSLAFPIYDPPEKFLFGRAVYFKGAWVLHMLRHMVGNDIFRQISQTYFNAYEYQNVITDDFITVSENISNRNLDAFFDQWLNYGGWPELFASWQQQGNKLLISIDQHQPDLVYQFDLEIEINGVSGDTLIIMPLTERNESVQLIYSDRITRIVIDPDNKILQTNNTPLYYIPQKTDFVNLYPNPFNKDLNIEYQSDKFQMVTIKIWDILGQHIATLLDEKVPIGVHRITWYAPWEASGTYFCTIHTQNHTNVRKVVLLK